MKKILIIQSSRDMADAVEYAVISFNGTNIETHSTGHISLQFLKENKDYIEWLKSSTESYYIVDIT